MIDILIGLGWLAMLASGPVVLALIFLGGGGGVRHPKTDPPRRHECETGEQA